MLPSKQISAWKKKKDAIDCKLFYIVQQESVIIDLVNIDEWQRRVATAECWPFTTTLHSQKGKDPLFME